jgi:hypothetical protein
MNPTTAHKGCNKGAPFVDKQSPLFCQEAEEPQLIFIKTGQTMRALALDRVSG